MDNKKIEEAFAIANSYALCAQTYEEENDLSPRSIEKRAVFQMAEAFLDLHTLAYLAQAAELERQFDALCRIKDLGNGEHMSIARNLALAALNPKEKP